MRMIGWSRRCYPPRFSLVSSRDGTIAAGRALGDRKLQAEGTAESVRGKTRNAVGGAKDAIRGKGRTRTTRDLPDRR